ncbi:prephenate/arogenate dehydrogenase [Phormidium pseudopriestleyi FRX01]|uniref:Prephenate/arogenate dehydrogenase n=1 Tax=Phormidium pseudopriestleyi FRX01 TaxID=1759528 RepID=A0ABS3FVZ8_9CYAN|nr:prephenate/arogenate dehydrogenase [Phormidium pseudopriestleyi]MBO0351285.1 prephenate/arogenate dehydrogenase [Phormidium pseudopriestleyi FRX01]
MNVGIVGLGLIGGSLALDLRSQGHRILGVSRRLQTCQEAVTRQIVDEADVEMTLMANAEVVFICTPIAAIARTVERLVPHLNPTAIITDVGSVKMPVVEAVTPLWPNFVPAHPMAGTAESGLDAAVPNLFVGRSYVITPTEHTPDAAVEIVTQLARSVGSQVYQCSPEDHDCAVAWISHLPVFVSASLISACLKEPVGHRLKLAQQLASSGFRDTSRVGGGHPELGVMMAQYNRGEVLRSLYAYRDQLNQFIGAIEAEDWNALTQALEQTQKHRPFFVGTPDSQEHSP